MNLETYIETINRQLEVAAEASGEEGRALAERLVAPLEAAIRLALQDALSAAAEEITLELAPGSVELRLRGRDPEFVVTLAPSDPPPEEQVEGEEPATLRGSGEGDDAIVARINLRLPEYLKAQVEGAAAAQGLSVNAWLVRAAASAVDRSDQARRRERRAPQGAQRYTGWAR